MFWYYWVVLGRSFHASVEWALGQGILLSGLMALSAIVYVAIRSTREPRQGRAMKIAQATKDFFIAFVFAAVFVIGVMWVYFFLRDAPDQIAGLTSKLQEAQKRADAANSPARIEVGFSEIIRVGFNVGEISIHLQNMGAHAAQRLQGRIYQLDDQYKQTGSIRIFVANDVVGNTGEVIIRSNEAAFSFVDGKPRLYLIVYTYVDKVTKKVYRNISYKKWFGLNPNGSGTLLLEDPDETEVKKLQSLLSEEIAPYQDTSD